MKLTLDRHHLLYLFLLIIFLHLYLFAVHQTLKIFLYIYLIGSLLHLNYRFQDARSLHLVELTPEQTYDLSNKNLTRAPLMIHVLQNTHQTEKKLNPLEKDFLFFACHSFIFTHFQAGYQHGI